jgi:cytochrome P450
VVSRHEDVSAVLKDYKSFSSARNEVTGDRGSVSQPPMPFKALIPEELDPPEFTPYKRALTGMLSPARVSEELLPRLDHWIDYFIDQVIEKGECDLVYDLTSPVAGAIALEWLGMPRDDWQRISKAYHDIVGYPLEDERAQAALRDLGWIDERIAEEVAIRQREIADGRPRNDVISALLQEEIDGAPMAVDRVESMARILIAGGVDTSTSTVTSALVHLHHHRDHRAALIADPELWTTAADEFVRRYPAVLAHARTVVRDVEVGGCVMKPGERILASEASACWDEAEFPDADRVILDRVPNRHVGFGLGIHRCPGMHLARETIRHLTKRILERMPDYEVDEASLVRYAKQSTVSGWVTARATFTPGPRVLPQDQTR